MYVRPSAGCVCSCPTSSVPFAAFLAVVLVCFCYLLVNIAYIAVLTPGEIEGLTEVGEAIALVRGTLGLVLRA